MLSQAEELEKLAQLKKDGTISEKEFEKKKALLLKTDAYDKTKEPKKKGCLTGILITIGIIILLAVIGIVSGNKSKENSTNTTGTNDQQEITYTTVDMESFIKEYNDNEVSAGNKYSGTYIETTGYISNIDDTLGVTSISIQVKNNSFLETYILCYPDSSDAVLSLKKSQKITIKGLVKDESFGSISIKNCIVVK